MKYIDRGAEILKRVSVDNYCEACNV